jgi:hypothetical protein
MKHYEIGLYFTGGYEILANNADEAIEIAMEKARVQYGSEIADYAGFRIEPNENNEEILWPKRVIYDY